jgi:hypothetical protein
MMCRIHLDREVGSNQRDVTHSVRASVRGISVTLEVEPALIVTCLDTPDQRGTTFELDRESRFETNCTLLYKFVLAKPVFQLGCRSSLVSSLEEHTKKCAQSSCKSVFLTQLVTGYV